MSGVGSGWGKHPLGDKNSDFYDMVLLSLKHPDQSDHLLKAAFSYE